MYRMNVVFRAHITRPFGFSMSWPKTCVFHAHTRRCHDRTTERLQEKPRKTGSIGIDMWTIKSSAQRASRAREKRTHCNTLYALQMANDRCAHQNCIFGFFKTKFLQFQNPGSDPYLLVFDWWSVRTPGTIANWWYIHTCVNSGFKLRSGPRRECCGGNCDYLGVQVWITISCKRVRVMWNWGLN